MRFRWLYEREPPLARRLWLLPLGAASRLYSVLTLLRRVLHRRGWLRQTRLACRVVSVGGLMVGGSGKTPTAAWIARSLRERGHRVVIASRGYGRESRDPVVVVSDGRRVYGHVATAGDEPMLLAAHAPDVPVLVGRDRAVVGMRAVAAFGAEVLVLDDGFQHLRLLRDIDVAVFDGRVGLGNGRVLPRGPLREAPSVLAAADAVGVIGGSLPGEDQERVGRLVPGAFRFSGRRAPVGLRQLAGGPPVPPEALAGRRVGMITGIAQPESFRETLESLGARVVAERVFLDHHRYRPRDLAGLAREAETWLTTQKDAIKIPASWAGDADVRVLSIELEVDEPEPLLDWLEERLRESASRF